MNLMEVCGTVVTGFEEIARKEIISKISNVSNIHHRRGNVTFTVEFESLRSLLLLRSIDNLFVIFYENTIEGLRKMEKDVAMKTIQNEISFMNWKKGIEAWQEIRQRNIYGGVDGVVEQMRRYMKEGIKTDVTEESPKYRVTCKRAGDKGMHQFTSMDAAWKFGAEINNVFGWKTSMKEFDIEVVLRIEQDSMTVMISLNDESMFKRNICAYGPTTMRSTMCYCMVSMLEPRDGDIILDAMCGGGSIPIEGAITNRNAFFIGGDNHQMAMDRCQLNWENNKTVIGGNCDFCMWDALSLPFKDNSIDGIVTDLPFGKKIGSTVDNRLLYPKLLEEWNRVLKIGGRLVILTHDKRSLANSKTRETTFWQNQQCYTVNVGGLSCYCLKLVKVQPPK